MICRQGVVKVKKLVALSNSKSLARIDVAYIQTVRRVSNAVTIVRVKGHK